MKKGTGSVVQRKRGFHARWRLNGKDVYGPERETWAEADRDRVLMAPDAKRSAPKGYHPTLQEWAYWCMDTANERYGIYGRGLAPGTFGTNETIRLTTLEGSALGRKKLRAIDQHDVDLWLEGIERHTAVRTKGQPTRYVPAGPAGAAWKNRCRAFVSRLFTLAESHGFVRTNPVRFAQAAHVPERVNRILSKDELAAFVDPKTRIDQIILVAALTGLRRGEICRIQWPDVQGENLIVRSTPNKGGTRLLPIAAEALAALLNQPKRGIHVFTTESGKPLSPRNLTRDVRRRFDELGIPKETRLQDLRGTFLTQLIRAGVDIKTTQILARHSSERTTMKSYLRSDDSAQRGAIESLRDRLGLGAPDDIGAADRGSKTG